MSDFVILVVEDDPLLRQLAQKQLTLLGYTSEVVGTGEEAVTRANADIALILMDIGLPGMDGIQTTLLIREKELREQRKPVPIIALTAHSNKPRCLLSGINGFLQKPAMLADLELVLHDCLPGLKR